jgi:hypothetical protein
MPLNSSGPISIGGATAGQSINLEFGRAATQQTSLSQLYRGGGIVTENNTNVPTSGPISLGQFYSAAAQFTFTVSSNQTNANLRTLAVNAGWNQAVRVVCTINSGIYVSSNNTNTPALTIEGAFPGGVEVINNGFVVGRGGTGGGGANIGSNGGPGIAGGTALLAQVSVSINNQGTIGGGGGGGGGGQSTWDIIFDPFTGQDTNRGATGGGGGGGRSGPAANGLGGAKGTGFSTLNAVDQQRASAAGSSGTESSGGAGGIGGQIGSFGFGGTGGAGGTWGATGGAGGSASGLTSFNNGGAATAGGAAVNGNSNITWVATGTRLGAIT